MDEEILNNMSVEPTESATVDETSAVEPSTESAVEAESGHDEVNAVENNDANGNVEQTQQKKQYTDLEKAQYSFHKQFARQKAKHDKEIADLRAEFNKRLAEDKKAVFNSVLRYKDMVIEDRRATLVKEMQSCTSIDDQLILLQKKKKLDDIRTRINRDLGIVITK